MYLRYFHWTYKIFSECLLLSWFTRGKHLVSYIKLIAWPSSNTSLKGLNFSLGIKDVSKQESWVDQGFYDKQKWVSIHESPHFVKWLHVKLGQVIGQINPYLE